MGLIDLSLLMFSLQLNVVLNFVLLYGDLDGNFISIVCVCSDGLAHNLCIIFCRLCIVYRFNKAVFCVTDEVVLTVLCGIVMRFFVSEKRLCVY